MCGVFNAACCVLVTDDWGGEECTVAWMGGNDKDIPVHRFIFSPSYIPLRSNHAGCVSERCVCVEITHCLLSYEPRPCNL